jgi:chemotaxis protein MotB
VDPHHSSGGGHSGPNHERWMVSYADFVTLLFAVFVVLFASSNMSKEKAREVSDSVDVALKSGLLSFVSKSKVPGPVGSSHESLEGTRGPAGEQERIAELLPSLDSLNKEFREQIEHGQLAVHLEPRGLVISLRQAAFFPSGAADITPSTYPVMEKLAAVIQGVGQPVRLEGHTDAIPIHNSRFQNNWDLSAARSIAMLNLLVDRYHVPRERLSIAGFADTVPVESNDNAEGRAHNRRVDVVILNDTVRAKELPAKPAGAHH